MLATAGLVASCVVLAVATPQAGQSPTIPAAELARYPPIVFTWAEPSHVKHTATGDLYVVKADGSGLRRVRSWPSFAVGRDGVYGAGEAVWSPDRSSIGLRLGMWEGDPYFATAVVSADGRRLRRLGPWEFGLSGLAWMPTGRTLVFGVSNHIYVHSVASRSTRRILRARPADRFAYFSGLDVAPDGRRVVAASARGSIYAMASDGTGLIRLTAGEDGDLDVSPDGRVVAFTRGVYLGENLSVWTVRSDGKGAPRRLVRGFGPRWSPDGRWIAFTSRGGVASLVSRDGRDVRRLASGRVVDWSPDGKMVLFVRESAQGDLWVMDADGGRQTPLLPNQLPWSVLTADWRS